MADPKVRFKRSSVPGKIPNETQVPLGEIALNTYDGKVFASKNVGIGTTVFVVNPWNVGAGTDVYDINFTIGNVGIGSTLPSSKLSVVGDVNISGVTTAISFSGSGTNLTGIVTSIIAGNNVTVSGSTGQVTIDVGGASQWISTTAGIHTLSSVGIGTTNPTSTLTVAGNVLVSGVVTASSFFGDGSGLTNVTAGLNTEPIQGINYILTLTPTFDGVTTIFTLLYNGNNYVPYNEEQLLVSLGGIIQEPNVAYTVSGSTITFSTAPNSETDYFIIAINDASSVSRNRQVYNVSGVQTNFTLTNGYTVDYVDVYLNGARLIIDTDYTATDGSIVGLTSAAQDGDVVEIIGYNALSKIVSNDLTVIGNLTVSQESYLLGDVGIGTTNPQFDLDVTGDINFTGTFYQNGSPFVASRWTAGAGTTIYRLSNVGIGTTNPTESLHVIGNILASGTVTANSDKSLKGNIQIIPNALDKVLQLRGVEFDRKDIKEHQIGVIAQEVEKIVPEVVYGDKIKSVAYGNLVALLIEAIKEQQVQINQLKQDLNKYIKTSE